MTDPKFFINEIASGLDAPSDLIFIDGDILISQKFNGDIKLFQNLFGLKKYPIISLDSSTYGDNGGLSGLATTTVGNTTYVFAFNGENSEKTTNSRGIDSKFNRIYRYVWNSSGLELDNSTIVFEVPANQYFINNGGKMATDSNNNLYITLGDMNRNGLEQNQPNSGYDNIFIENYKKSGVIIRITPQGNPNVYNPFPDNDFEYYFAFGIRNSLGLAFDPVTKYLWDTEQGPDSNDEINLVKPGFNSGWKVIQGDSSDKCCFDNITLPQDRNQLYDIEGGFYDDPKLTFRNSTQLTSMVFFNSTLLGKEYLNTLFVGDMNGNIYNFGLSKNREDIINFDNNITKNMFATGFGPISDLSVGNDGLLYVLTFSNNTNSPYEINSGQLFSISIVPNKLDIESEFVSYDQIGLITTAIVIIVILSSLRFKNIIGGIRRMINHK
ncbi:MAG: PQQ-dependent sugar dehydrogenase [Candidatus Nitrosocosmicus sp.]|nr:PQQ-dependent sugar dehydrogenase [Candidatus Nitrosocosmicus sp.]